MDLVAQPADRTRRVVNATLGEAQQCQAGLRRVAVPAGALVCLLRIGEVSPQPVQSAR